MRVLHFLPVYAPAWQFGGPILSVSRLCEGLVQLGVDVRVITTNAGLPDFPIQQLGHPQEINGVKVFYYAVDRQGGTISSRHLVSELSEHMKWAQILHLSSVWQPLGLSVQKAAHSFRVPVIQTLRGALGPYSWRQGWWKKVPYFWLKERPMLQTASTLHCTTIQEAREIDWLGLRPPVQILSNPLDFNKLQTVPQLGQDWRQRVGISLDEPLFLVAGRMHHKKGLEILPNVLKAISQRSWQIAFIGNDDDGTGLRLKLALRRAGLADRCHWFQHMPVDQLSEPYNAADCLLLPSHHENFGNVVVEALACGCGVLISDRVGVGETLRPCPGVRIIPRSNQRWIAHLEDILDTQRPGSIAAQWVHSTFSSELVAKQAINIYESVVNHG